MKNRLFVLGLLFISCDVLSQNLKPALPYAAQITSDQLRGDLSILASDALEGRETGTRGQKMAAAFIKSHFEEIGLKGPVNGDYYQPVTLYTSVPGEIFIKAGEKTFHNFKDIVYYGTASSNGNVTSDVVFLGKGRKEDFDQVDVAGKTVLIVKDHENYRGPVAIARERNAKMILMFNPGRADFDAILEQWKSYLSGGLLSLKKPELHPTNSGVFFVSPEVASAVMNTSIEKLENAAKEDIKKKPLKKIKTGTLTYWTGMEIKELKSNNVLGFLEGTDKKDEIIVITAHYDHIGKLSSGKGDLINNGADDDGSGTVALLHIAKAFAQAKKEGNGPRRSILFMTVTGEEKGLLGSDYYTQFPVFPLSSTVVDLNIDMVGRRDPQHKDSSPYVYVIGADKLSTKLNQVSEAVNKAGNNLVFDYTYNDQNHPDRLYYRSDHWNFAKNNIPVIFYFDGIHEDYHKPSDEVDKIEFDLLKLRAQTVFLTAWEIANMNERIVPDQPK